MLILEWSNHTGVRSLLTPAPGGMGERVGQGNDGLIMKERGRKKNKIRNVKASSPVAMASLTVALKKPSLHFYCWVWYYTAWDNPAACFVPGAGCPLPASCPPQADWLEW